MAQYTPMIQQYLEIKQQVPDAILFFRLGDFYEMFFEDAALASAELEITLTGREGGAAERIPMCGVPYHSADNYISRLIEKGYKVAICEQVENPAEAKGVVRREIVRVVTPGTMMEGKALSDGENNYMVSLARSGHEFALAACDVTTGELHHTTVNGSIAQILDEAAVYQPSELIVDPSLTDECRERTMAWTKVPLINGIRVDEPEEAAAHFGKSGWEALSASGRLCISMLMKYLIETQKRSLAHIREIRFYETDQFMRLDAFTRRNLELMETVRDRSRKGSLLWLLDETVTAMGGRQLRRWLDKPLLQKSRIEERLEAVECLYGQLITREELRQRLKQVYDMERLVGRISFGNANAKDLIALKTSLEQVPELISICMQSGSITLQNLVSAADPCSDVLEWIRESIADDPPLGVKDGGLIKEGFDAHLDKLREASTSGKRWITELEQQERQSTGIKSLKIGYNKVFGYYIEVTRANAASLPEGRYERKQTLANAERFITPELKEKEALILEAEEKMVELEYQLFVQLRDRILDEIPRLQLLADLVCEMDVYQSLATVSAKYHYTKPMISENSHLHIEEGRHPVVEAVMESEAFIPNDTLLFDDLKMMLITGPNMAGKSTYMRQVALICIMAQIGCFVPAQKAQIPVLDRIFTRIGAADDLVRGQSTFMVEMRDIQLMTEKATPQSLVIIDELGRGTSTSEGMAIAQAVIEFLHDEIGCLTLVSTHYHELAHLEGQLPLLRNFCMAVKEKDGEVTFLRKLIEGAADSSYGIYCAKIAGLPGNIIRRANQLLDILEGTGEAATAAAIRSDAAPDPAVTEEPARAAGNDKVMEQISWFGDIPEPSSRNKEKQELAPAAAEVVNRIKEAELMNMTPLDAMNFLHSLRMKLKEYDE
ncbi:DNA mismatch repair protein MutS [Marinicrinis lubricantis]|uniref:DNA mismatch repair protein MutS n=1 Tax=Marinicrinis lubricantis TaxID=2086470 RepID=A0ABW1ITI2_9BACL